MAIQLKRAYEKPAKNDGFRVLVDRLWPRGLKKDQAKIDLWLKEIAPSSELRNWFGHDPERWKEFKKRYNHELADYREELESLAIKARRGRVTLVYGAKDTEHNNAVVLQEYIERKLKL
jgi:uncharacterized protein YeaO (DUF488 family)